MSAPTKERPRAGWGTSVLDDPPREVGKRRGTGTRGARARQTTIPAPRGAGAPTRTGRTGTALLGPDGSAPVGLLDTAGRPGADRSAMGRIGKAYARRDGRLRRLVGAQGHGSAQVAPAAGRTPFVLLVMVLLAVGLVATLWLSTAAAADSFRLTDARSAAQALSERSEQLHRQVAAMDAAPALAQRAGQLGMVPVTEAARLVVAPDGSVTVVGTPTAAVAAVVPVAPAPARAAVTTADGQVAAADQPMAGGPPAAGAGTATPAGPGAAGTAPAPTGTVPATTATAVTGSATPAGPTAGTPAAGSHAPSAPTAARQASAATHTTGR